MPQGILTFAEQRDGKLKKTAMEALSAALELKQELGGDITALVIGKDIQAEAAKLKAFGADAVIAFDQDFFAKYSTGGYGRCVVQATKHCDPAAIIIPSTIMGKDLAAYAAAQLKAGMITDCTELKVDAGKIQAIRPVYAGKALATVAAATDLTVLGIRPNVFAAKEINAGAVGDVQVLGAEFDLESIRALVKEIVAPENATLDVSEADIIVSGGRGVGSPEGFAPLEELAKVLGAAVGASRAVVDSGWRDHAAQVGQTGKVVSPTLYIAAGISGAIQHLAGMKTSKVIVAINKDPDAAIFKVANYGIVGDLFEVVPAMTEAFRGVLN